MRSDLTTETGSTGGREEGRKALLKQQEKQNGKSLSKYTNYIKEEDDMARL
jgi:hypothetical protein